ncbi:acylphosphatase [Celeribacter neptunius]|uniref:acylphosphatase n=1 Tax=Celeribacter neptunius TaxID=588602 RepID=A0A1I3QJF1_9RHOB|nr:acylphosphatase [Celeribacter neptunius]SFJ33895.1 acylphosphatase [Celeribacter neptunius]
MKRIARHVRILGKVQGVAYRAWTKSFADSEGITGWVRNEVDGSVAALLCGAEEPVERLLSAMWEGPGAAAVREVQVSHAMENVTSGFEILH